MATVQGNISWVGGLQIRRQFVAITPLECVRHQYIAVTFALMRRIDADQRQVPMRLARVVLRHLLENGGSLVARSWRGGTFHELAQLTFVGVHTGW